MLDPVKTIILCGPTAVQVGVPPMFLRNVPGLPLTGGGIEVASRIVPSRLRLCPEGISIVDPAWDLISFTLKTDIYIYSMIAIMPPLPLAPP